MTGEPVSAGGLRRGSVVESGRGYAPAAVPGHRALVDGDQLSGLAPQGRGIGVAALQCGASRP